MIPVISRTVLAANWLLSASNTQRTSDERPADIASDNNERHDDQDWRMTVHGVECQNAATPNEKS